MHVGMFGGFGTQWVDDDELCATSLPVECPLPSAGDGLQPIPSTDSGIRANQQEIVAVVDV